MRLPSNNANYTTYRNHSNTIKEPVDAGTVNQIQKDINITQLAQKNLQNDVFLNYVRDEFDSNLFVNASVRDIFDTAEYCDFSKSEHIELLENGVIALKQGETEGYLMTKPISSEFGPMVGLNDFFLLASVQIPIGAMLSAFLVTMHGEQWAITANQQKRPLHLQENLKQGFRIKFVLRANAGRQTPLLHGYSVFFWDEQVEANYKITNPDLQRFP